MVGGDDQQGLIPAAVGINPGFDGGESLIEGLLLFNQATGLVGVGGPVGGSPSIMMKRPSLSLPR